jgi:hypothetical protein
MTSTISLDTFRTRRAGSVLAAEMAADAAADALARDMLAALLSKVGAPGQPPAGPALRAVLRGAAAALVEGEGYDLADVAAMALSGAALAAAPAD